jgi:hypothetical protein
MRLCIGALPPARLLPTIFLGAFLAAPVTLPAAALPQRGPMCPLELQAPAPAPGPRSAEPAPRSPDSLQPGASIGTSPGAAVGTSAPNGGSSSRAAIDPETGELVVPPRPAPDVPRTRLEAFRIPYGEFRPQRLPGGGWKLGLQGRSLQPLFATVGSEGRITTRHRPVTPSPPDPEEERPDATGPGGERPEAQR